MKVKLNSLIDGRMRLELVGETETETAVLINAWRLMELGAKPFRGNGSTVTEMGATGFYLPVTPEELPDEEVRAAAKAHGQ